MDESLFEDKKKSVVRDFVWEGILSDWRHTDASALEEDLQLEADVVIIGTGSGGGTAAEILTQAGLQVVLIEEGPLKTSKDFNMDENEAYTHLYQESGARTTKDMGIKIFQGRMVGGGTGVNWTTSFRTPEPTLRYWTEAFDLKGFTPEEMQPWFDLVEKRYNINYWKIPPNENNSTIVRGCSKLGIPYGIIRRNVRGCQNLGYCGVGCPVNAKQSTLITTVAGALRAGATLISRARADTFELNNGKVEALNCRAMNTKGTAPSGRKVRVLARHFVLSAGAIASPAILLRTDNKILDPHGLVGKRTFLHPACASLARMPNLVNGEYGAPQSVYSDHFIESRLDNARIGYKLEAAPMQPMFMTSVLEGHGQTHAELMKMRPHLTITIALMRDGFHPESPGGAVYLKDDGSPGLDYPITPYVWDGILDALLNLAEIQFAAGAKFVLPVHRDAERYTSRQQAKEAINQLPMAILKMKVLSAHVMGGCRMGEDPTTSVVNSMGRHHEVENLSVFDASTFPTSIAANPMESIHGMVAKQATALAKEMAA